MLYDPIVTLLLILVPLFLAGGLVANYVDGR